MARKPAKKHNVKKGSDALNVQRCTILAQTEISVCKYMRLARERQRRDLLLGPSRGLVWRPEMGRRVVEFFEKYLHHHKGEWAGKPFILADWQKNDIIMPLFSWYRADGTRRFNVALVEIPKKNGKSELGAGIGLYLTGGDGEMGAEVYSSATKRDQAKIVHDAAQAMLRYSPELRQIYRSLTGNINVPATMSKFEPLGADADTLDGPSPSGNIVDELHAHKTRKLWDVLMTAMAARRNPLTFAITTAGVYDPTSIGWQMHDDAVKLLEGVFDDDSFFVFISAADEDDDWMQEETWKKANPNFGISPKREFLQKQCVTAQRQPSAVNAFLRYHLNRWTQVEKRWIDMEKWRSCPTTPGLSACVSGMNSQSWVSCYQSFADIMKGKKCWPAMDLSSKVDITALVLLFPAADGFYDLFCRFYCPAEKVKTQPEHERIRYQPWVRDGWLIETPGNVVDYAFIEEDAKRFKDLFELQEFAYDQWNATQTAVRMQDMGFKMVEYNQSIKALCEPTKEFEKLVIGQKLRHNNNPVLTWMASNTAVHEDASGNIRPQKAKSTGKIDGIAASIMSLGRIISVPSKVKSVYEGRGVREL